MPRRMASTATTSCGAIRPNENSAGPVCPAAAIMRDDQPKSEVRRIGIGIRIAFIASPPGGVDGAVVLRDVEILAVARWRRFNLCAWGGNCLSDETDSYHRSIRTRRAE